MKKEIRDEIIKLIELNEITDPCDERIEQCVADHFPAEYDGTQGYYDFQMEIGKIVKETQTPEKLTDQIMEEIDLIELRKTLALSGSGSVWIYYDGSFEFHESNTRPSGKGRAIIATIKTAGRGNIDEDWYAEGWAKYDDEKDAWITEDGRKLSPDEMIAESIEEGEFDWYEMYNAIKDSIESK